MEHLLTQFQANLQAIQDDLIENFPVINGSITAMEGLKLDYWNDVSDDVSFMVNDIQAQLDAQVPMAVEAMEIETALRESMARSVESAFEVLSDASHHSSKSCFNLAGLYKAAQASNTKLQARLDDFYTCCKHRRAQHQHGLLEDMDRSLSKTRERAVSRCTKHMETTALNSKSRVRRLALRQQPQIPGDIQVVMNGVLEELQSFLDEASSRRRVPAAVPSGSKTAKSLEKALTHFFMDVSSGKTPSSQSAGGSEPIRDEFSTLTEPDAAEIQEAYFSCQYPIVDFPPDLAASQESNVQGISPPPSPGPEEPPQSPPPPPSPPSSSGDSMLGDFEVIEELDNLPDKGGSDEAAEVPEAMETEACFFEAAGPTDEGGGTAAEVTPAAEETPPVEEEKIFIDLCEDDGPHSDVEYLFEDHHTPPPPPLQEEKEELKVEKEDEVDSEELGDRRGSHGRNIFEVLQRSSPGRWSGGLEGTSEPSNAPPLAPKAPSILMQTSAEAFYADPAMVQEVEAAVQSITCDQTANSAPSTPGTILSPLEIVENEATSPASSEATEPGILPQDSPVPEPTDEDLCKNPPEEPQPPDLSKSLSSLASQLMALRNSDGSFNVPTSSVSQAVGVTPSSALESDALKLQLVNVLDRMVEMCEVPEAADDAKSRLSISARLDLMLRESFNLVASNRAGQGESGGSGGWQLSIDRTCADFQSQMSAALSSFLMSPASECGPIPSVAASDRVAAWDFPPSNEPSSCAPDALSELETGPALPASPEAVAQGLLCRNAGPDDFEEQNHNNSSSISALPAPATPEFPQNDNEETENGTTTITATATTTTSTTAIATTATKTTTTTTVETAPEEQILVPISAVLETEPKASFPEATQVEEPSCESPAVNFVDNNKINDEEILEVIFTSKPTEDSNANAELGNIETVLLSQWEDTGFENDEDVAIPHDENCSVETTEVNIETLHGCINEACNIETNEINIETLEECLYEEFDLETKEMNIETPQDYLYEQLNVETTEMNVEVPHQHVYEDCIVETTEMNIEIPPQDHLNEECSLESTEMNIETPHDSPYEGTTENDVNSMETSSFYTENRQMLRWTGCYVYFFRSEESEEAKRAEWLLLRSGACLFDPYHPHLLGATSRLAVFIHVKDVNYAHQIPNLLQLKNMRHVAFKVYEDNVDDCRDIFPAGSTCLVIDRDTLATTHPDNLVSLITFVREECQMNRPCRIVLHRQLYKYLSNISARCENRTELYRLERLRDLLTNPKQDGIIQWAGDVGPEVHVDLLQFMLDIQKRFQHMCRDFFLLTNIDANDLKSHIFARGGISVMNIHQFLINYTTKPYNAYSCSSAANSSCLHSDLLDDAPLSWCVDVLPSVGCSAV